MAPSRWEDLAIFLVPWALPATCVASTCGYFCENWCQVKTCYRLACDPKDPKDCPGTRCLQDCSHTNIDAEKEEEPSGPPGGGIIMWIPVSIAITCCICVLGRIIFRFIYKPFRRKCEAEAVVEVEKSKWFGGDTSTVDIFGYSVDNAGGEPADDCSQQKVEKIYRREKTDTADTDKPKKKWRSNSWEERKAARAASPRTSKSATCDENSSPHDCKSPRSRSPRGARSARDAPLADDASETASVCSNKPKTDKPRKKRLDPLLKPKEAPEMGRQLSTVGEERLANVLQSMQLDIDTGVVPCRSTNKAGACPSNVPPDSEDLPEHDAMLPMSQAFSKERTKKSRSPTQSQKKTIELCRTSSL